MSLVKDRHLLKDNYLYHNQILDPMHIDLTSGHTSIILEALSICKQVGCYSEVFWSQSCNYKVKIGTEGKLSQTDVPNFTSMDFHMNL